MYTEVQKNITSIQSYTVILNKL